MLNFLLKKCPEKFIWKYAKRFSVFIFFIVFTLLLLFQPDGLRFLHFWGKIELALIFALVSSLTYYISYLIVRPYLNSWTWGKDLLWLTSMFSTAGILIYVSTELFALFIDPKLYEAPDRLTFLESFFYSFTIGLIVTIIISLIDQYYAGNLHKKEKESLISALLEENSPLKYELDKYDYLKQINQGFISSASSKSKFSSNQIKSQKATETITITGKNQSDILNLLPKNFVYAQANGNYIDIFYKSANNSNELEKAVLRTSISTISNLIKKYTYLFNSHRTYIVNLYEVNSIEGNNKSLKLLVNVKNKTIHIPVSRGKINQFKSVISELKLKI